MHFKISKKFLLFMAGTFWIVAGINVLRIGIVTWIEANQFSLFKIGEAIIICLLFFNFVFKKLYYKNTKRIEQKQDKSCPFSFFDIKGWIVMTCMITFGVVVRKYHLLPNTFISVFYTGLSIALTITGVLFLRQGWKNRTKKNNPVDQ